MPTRIDQLIHAQWLHENSEADRLVIEVGDGAQAAYRQGHLPGAIFLDTNALEHAPDWNLIPAADLERVLCAHGIASRQPVVLYGRDPLAAARAAWALLYAGVQDVRWLAGGLEAWRTAGYALETGDRPPSPVADFGGPFPAHPEYLISREQVARLLADPGAAVVCTRDREEYDGQVSGYAYIQAKGRLPGSLWGGYPWPGLRPVEHSRSPADAARLGRTGHHARQANRFLLRHRLARQRGLLLRLPARLAAHRRL